jgi:hypothetical protein
MHLLDSRPVNLGLPNGSQIYGRRIYKKVGRGFERVPKGTERLGGGK